MSAAKYVLARTGLLLIDPYNDFLSDGGKVFPMLASLAAEIGLVANLKSLAAQVRSGGGRVFYVPHRRWQSGDYDGWHCATATQKAAQHLKLFERGSWGAEWHPDLQPEAGDVIVGEHWAQSGFANTDLDFQLKQHGCCQSNASLAPEARFAA